RGGHLPLPLHRRRRELPRARDAVPADAARRRRAGRAALILAVSPDDVPFWPWGVLMLFVGLYLVGIAALIGAGRREDARALAGFMPDCLVLVSRLARDPEVSRPRRAVLFLVLAYLAFPLDLVPDFLPGVGQLDDAILVGLALRLVVHGGGAERVRDA